MVSCTAEEAAWLPWREWLFMPQVCFSAGQLGAKLGYPKPLASVAGVVVYATGLLFRLPCWGEVTNHS
jgi:hypothetical protein